MALVDRHDPAALLDPGAEAEKARGRAPRPPAEEVAGRLRRARAAIAAAGLDGLVIYGSAGIGSEPIRYLANYVHVFPGAGSLLFLPLDRPPILVVDQPWHLDEARRMATVADVRAAPSPARRWLHDELRATLAGALGDAGLAGGRLGVLSADLPRAYADMLAAAAPKATLADGTAAWHELVATPSAYDGDMIRRTAAVADAGLAAAMAAAGDGVPEHEVCLAALGSMASLGAEFLHGSGATTHINIGSSSDVVSNVRPFLYTTEPLRAGQMFWLDLSASYAGYYIDTDRTIAIGEPTADQRRIADVVTEMYELMLAEARPGVRGGDLWERANRIGVDAGFGEHGNHVYLGHTTGIATSVRPVVAPGEAGELREGSFLNVEPGVFVPGVGAACIENTLHLTAGGATPINRQPIGVHVVEV